MSKPEFPVCAKCPTRICLENTYPDSESYNEAVPDFCPTKLDSDAIERAWKEYLKQDVREFARLASKQEAECYEIIDGETRTKIPRIEETIQFARKMKYKKLGIVFCIGLRNEALMLTRLFEDRGFEVVSVNCKVGGIAKEEIGLKPEEKIRGPLANESMCNPIAQAEIMNNEAPDWVIMLGLCVGHDTLFIKYCKRPITILAVKDRVLAHNPLGALYLTQSPYYRRLAPGDK
jgi:uncharacterized metal-binding protein